MAKLRDLSFWPAAKSEDPGPMGGFEGRLDGVPSHEARAAKYACASGCRLEALHAALYEAAGVGLLGGLLEGGEASPVASIASLGPLLVHGDDAFSRRDGRAPAVVAALRRGAFARTLVDLRLECSPTRAALEGLATCFRLATRRGDLRRDLRLQLAVDVERLDDDWSDCSEDASDDDDARPPPLYDDEDDTDFDDDDLDDDDARRARRAAAFLEDVVLRKLSFLRSLALVADVHNVILSPALRRLRARKRRSQLALARKQRTMCMYLKGHRCGPSCGLHHPNVSVLSFEEARWLPLSFS